MDNLFFEIVRDHLGVAKIFGPLTNIKRVIGNQKYKYCQTLKNKVVSVFKENEILEVENSELVKTLTINN